MKSKDQNYLIRENINLGFISFLWEKKSINRKPLASKDAHVYLKTNKHVKKTPKKSLVCMVWEKKTHTHIMAFNRILLTQ